MNKGEENITPECIDKLLERTKRRGRGKALKTLLAEKENEAGKAPDAQKRKEGESSSDDDTPRRPQSAQTTNLTACNKL